MPCNLIFTVLLFNLMDTPCVLHEVRVAFHEATSHEKLTQFLENYADLSCEQATPYMAAATMMMAKYTVWPQKKWKYFQYGKEQLERYILNHPECVEGRYVRFLIQTNLPPLLGYKDAIAPDKIFIIDHLNIADLPHAYKKRIRTYIQSKKVTSI